MARAARSQKTRAADVPHPRCTPPKPPGPASRVEFGHGLDLAAGSCELMAAASGYRVPH